MPMLRASILLCFTLLLLAGCASQSQPDWLQGESDLFPASRYLTALGEGDNGQTAADRALANLARILAVDVNEQSSDSSLAELRTEDGRTVTRNEQTVSRELTLRGEQLLEGARISERWQREDGREFALATLDRQATARLLEGDIRLLAGRVDDLVRFANGGAGNPVAALQSLQQAVTSQLQAEALNRKLRVVNDDSIALAFTSAELIDQLRTALAMMPVSIEANRATLRAQLESAVSQLGIRVADQAHFVVRAELDVTPIQKIQGWYWIRGAYVLSLQDGATVLSQQRYPIKVSATDTAMVRQRMRDVVDTTLPENLFGLFAGERTAP